MKNGGLKLVEHVDWKITRLTKVKGEKSPYDGDFIYWAIFFQWNTNESSGGICVERQ